MQLDHAVTKAVRVLLLQNDIRVTSISDQIGMGNQSVINLLGNRNRWTMQKLSMFARLLNVEAWEIVKQAQEIKGDEQSGKGE